MDREKPQGTSAAWSIHDHTGQGRQFRSTAVPIDQVRSASDVDRVPPIGTNPVNSDRRPPPWQSPRSDRQPPPKYTSPAGEAVDTTGSQRGENWTPPWSAPGGPQLEQSAAGERAQTGPVPTGQFYPPTSQDLAPDALLKRPRRASTSGWRRGVHRLTGGVINPGESTAEERYRNQVDRIRQPVLGDYRIAFLSLKGGVGKTTTTLGLGSTFASLRGDCVIAVDANPDFGTLGERVPRQTSSTVRDLLADAPNIRRYSDIRAHTSQAPSRLEVLAGERDPAASEMFGEQDYRSVIEMLQVYYNLILTDCGTGIMHSAMNGVLQLANALVLVSSPAVDGARSAAATLDWLQLHGYGHLVERTVVVISSVRPGSSTVDMNLLTQHFLERCRAVLVVPFDEHLAEGAVVDLNLLRPQTRSAFVELAAMVADDFPVASGRHSGANWR